MTINLASSPLATIAPGKRFVPVKNSLESELPPGRLQAVAERKQFHDDRVASRPEELQRQYHQLLRNYFAFLVPPGQRVLEMGCGLGDLLNSVQPSRAVGVDFSPKAVVAARARHPQGEFHVADVTEFEPGEKFWCVG